MTTTVWLRKKKVLPEAQASGNEIKKMIWEQE